MSDSEPKSPEEDEEEQAGENDSKASRFELPEFVPVEGAASRETGPGSTFGVDAEGLPTPSAAAQAAAEELLKQWDTAPVSQAEPLSEEEEVEDAVAPDAGGDEPRPYGAVDEDAQETAGSEAEPLVDSVPGSELRLQAEDEAEVPSDSGPGSELPPEAEEEGEAEPRNAVHVPESPTSPVAAVSDGLKPRVEALLFASSTPLKLSDFCRLLERSKNAVKRALDDLVAEFASRDGALAVSRQPGGYSIVLKSDYQEVASLLMPPELEPVLLKTLSIVAIHQPLTQSRLVELRGSSAYEHVKELVQKGMVKRKREGNTFILRTTKLFATRFRVEDDPERIREAMLIFEQRAAELAAAGAQMGHDTAAPLSAAEAPVESKPAATGPDTAS